MNIITFDTEEWYLEKVVHGGRAFKNQAFDMTLVKLLDDLDRLDIKATFFCLGKLATVFPDVVKRIASRGHEIGCHSNEHIWLNKMSEKELRKDTMEAIKALEDVSGQKVVSYRAPAFSITSNNKWAVSVLAECGIKNDASVFPTSRDFGGYKDFQQDSPCIIRYQGASLKEFPICLTSILGKRFTYSGGGYFRILPYWLINWTMKQRDYNICYFHLKDFIDYEVNFLTKEKYEQYFKEKGTLKNRWIRYIKDNMKLGNSYEKMLRLVSKMDFINIAEAEKEIDWAKEEKINL